LHLWVYILGGDKIPSLSFQPETKHFSRDQGKQYFLPQAPAGSALGVHITDIEVSLCSHISEDKKSCATMRSGKIVVMGRKLSQEKHLFYGSENFTQLNLPHGTF
jgi:hypothetical protein